MRNVKKVKIILNNITYNVVCKRQKLLLNTNLCMFNWIKFSHNYIKYQLYTKMISGYMELIFLSSSCEKR